MTALLWELLFFALLKQAWVERHVLGPLAKAQETIAHWYGAPERASIAVTADCSGADVMALCLGVLLAYPVGWRRRLGGMAGALAVILTLNTLRIVTLLFASSPRSIQHLHLVVWPIVIVFALALYVSWWMRAADRHGESSRWRTSRFAAAASCLLVLYAATAPWTMTSPAVTQRRGVDRGLWCGFASVDWLAGFGCRRCHGHTARFIPGHPRVPPHTVLARVSGGDRGDALVPRRRMLAVALMLPLFFALGVTRLIALALPAAIATTPLVIVHGFYQLVGGIALIGVASAAARHLTPPVSGGAHRWRAGWSFAAGIAGAFVTAAVAGSAWTRLVTGMRGGSERGGDAHVDDDPAGRLSGGTCLAADLPPRLARGILDRPHERTPARSGRDRAVPSCSRGRRDARAHWRGTDPPGRRRRMCSSSVRGPLGCRRRWRGCCS